MNLTYLRMEIKRTFRNRRFFIFSLMFPILLFYFIAGPQRNPQLGGIAFAAYYLGGMASFGTTAAMLANGGRIAGERTVGWNRQLRMTPLKPLPYFAAKLISSYLMAGLTVVLLLIAGLTLGVHEKALGVLEMVGYVAVGLIPFAALGIFIGHKFTIDSIGPILGGGVALLSIVGGAYGPLSGSSGFMFDLSRSTPTYWLVQAGHTLIGGPGWPLRGWVTIAIWSAVLGRLALYSYRTDTKRQ
jgi:ABC-2 type transport system permease protein